MTAAAPADGGVGGPAEHRRCSSWRTPSSRCASCGWSAEGDGGAGRPAPSGAAKRARAKPLPVPAAGPAAGRYALRSRQLGAMAWQGGWHLRRRQDGVAANRRGAPGRGWRRRRLALRRADGSGSYGAGRRGRRCAMRLPPPVRGGAAVLPETRTSRLVPGRILADTSLRGEGPGHADRHPVPLPCAAGPYRPRSAGRAHARDPRRPPRPLGRHRHHHPPRRAGGRCSILAWRSAKATTDARGGAAQRNAGGNESA